MKKGSEVCIIGAGIAGLSAADRLVQAGINPVILEKSRGVGGRMATRRFAGGVHDSGAQYISVRSQEFQYVMDAAFVSGVVRPWAEGFPFLTPALEEESPARLEHPRWCGSQGMTSLPKLLSAKLDIRLGWQLASLQLLPQRLILESELGDVLECDHVLLTAPAPQTVELLKRLESCWIQPAWQLLQSVQYHPCIAVMLSLDRQSAMPPPGGAFVREGIFRWVADNKLKGISPTPSLTLHCAPEFSREWYDRTDEEIAAVVLEAARGWIGRASVLEVQIRRWKYSQPVAPLDESHLVLHTGPGVVVAGDSLLGSKVEGAFLSGLRAAERLLELAGCKSF
jgi:renalase